MGNEQATSKLASFNNIKTYAFIIYVAIFIGLPIILSIFVLINTGDWKPLFEKTVGLLAGYDKSIGDATTQLMNPSLNLDMTSFYAYQLISGLVFFMIFIYLLKLFWHSLLGIFQPKDMVLFWIPYAFAIASIIILGAVYNKVFLNVWNPFEGLMLFFKNFELITNNVNNILKGSLI